jgi:hypothetical protein
MIREKREFLNTHTHTQTQRERGREGGREGEKMKELIPPKKIKSKKVSWLSAFLLAMGP